MSAASVVPMSRVLHVRDHGHAESLLREFRPKLGDEERWELASRLASGFAVLILDDEFEELDAAAPAHWNAPAYKPEPTTPRQPSPRAAPDKTWIAVKCLGPHGESYAGAAFRMRLPEGAVRHGVLDGGSNWATRDLEEGGTCHFELEANVRVNDAAPAIDGFVPRPSDPRLKPGASVGLVSGREHTVVVQESRAACVRLVGMMFALNKAFILPEALEGIRLVRHMYEIQPTAELLVVGHTDTTGLASRNRSLSLARARAVIAYLRDDTDHWCDLYTANTDYSRRWGKEEDLSMLSALPFGEAPFYGQHHAEHSLAAAVRRFQASRDLVVDGDAGDDTRRALIAEYMAADDTTLPSDASVVAHGCGQNFLAVETDNGVEELENRRVEVFFFRDGVDPAPADDAHYPAWVETVDQERTFRPSAAGIGELLVVTDIEAEFANEAEVEFTLRSTDGAYAETLLPHQHGENVYGYVELRFANLPKGSFYTLVMRDHAEAEHVLFDDVPFRELGGVAEDHEDDLIDPVSGKVVGS